MKQKIRLMNIFYNNLTHEELVDHVAEQIIEKKPSYMVFINVDVVIKAETDTCLRTIINQSDFSLIDGMPLVWIAHFFRAPIKEKISGSDFVPLLCRRAAEKGWRVFLLGGAEGIPELAGEQLRKKYPGLLIAGTYSPPMGFEQNQEELKKIKDSIVRAAPDILVVCFGCPKQEKFVCEHYEEYGVPVSICAGATLDFLSGRIRRSPAWMSRIGLEWLYRFSREPRRLFKRYFIDDMKIIPMVAAFWLRPKAYLEEKQKTDKCMEPSGGKENVKNRTGS